MKVVFYYPQTTFKRLVVLIFFLTIDNYVFSQSSDLCRGDYRTEEGRKAMLAKFSTQLTSLPEKSLLNVTGLQQINVQRGSENAR